MNEDELRRLLGQKEGLKLDFKQELYKLDSEKGKELEWNEFIKDILALANGNFGTANQTGYLIIGVANEINTDGTRDLYDVILPKDDASFASTVLDRVNAICDPPLPDLQCQTIVINDKRIVVISIPPSPFLYELTKRIRTPKREFDERTLLIRRSEGIRIATEDERQAIRKEKERIYGVPYHFAQADAQTISSQLEDIRLFNRTTAVPEMVIQNGYLLAKRQPPRAMLRERQVTYFERHRLFGGRDAELQQMRDFLQTRQQGYIFVTGPSGYGKTALLANFLAPLQTKACWYFLNQLDNTHRRRDFLRQMCEQLLAYYQLPLQSEADLPFEEDRLEALYAKLLRMPLVQTGQPLVLVIDGVDEAELNPMRGKPFLNDLHIPRCLPPGKFIIFSCRDTGQAEVANLGLPPAEVLTIRLQSLDLVGIKALLQVAGGQATDWANDEQLLSQVERVSEGDPFYLHYLVQDIMNGKLSPAQIKQQPTGLESYLDHWWEQVRRELRGDDIRNSLGTLMVTLGPLPSADFFQLYPDLEWNFEEVLAPVRRFVIESSGPAYTLCHPRFQTYLTEVKLKGQVAKYRAQLLAHCARWAAQQSKYALRFYAQHLAEAQQWEPLYTLAREPTFGPAQLRAFPNNPDLPLETLQLALDGAATTDNAGAMAEFLLAHARKLIDVRQESPLEALRQVSLERACKLADLYEPESKVLWYLLLAWDLHHQGRDEEARALLAKQVGERLPYLSWQAKIVNTFLCDLFAVDHHASKTLVQSLIEDGDDVLTAIAKAQVQTGDFPVALQTAQAIKDKWSRASVLSTIAEAQAQAGDIPAAVATFNLALQTAQAIENEWERAKALRNVAISQAKLGDFPAALQIAQEIENERERATALSTIAISQGQVGDISAASANLTLALQIAQAIEDELERATALESVAAAQAKLGDFPAALQTAQTIKNENLRAFVFSAIATALVQLGDISAALKFAQAIENEEQREDALSIIAKAQAQMGDITAALRTAQATKNEKEREDALSIISTTLQNAQEIKNEDQQPSIFSAIAISQAQVRDFPAALQTAQKIEGEWERAFPLSTIAKAQAQAGEFDAALKTAQEIEDKWGRAEALESIAAAQAQAGDFSNARQIAQAIEDKWGRANALSAIAAAQAQAGDIAEASETFSIALQTAKAIKDKGKRAWALSAIAAALAQAGDIAEASETFSIALQTAKAIRNEFERLHALRAVAKAQAQVGDITAALQSALEIKDEWQRALVQAEIGDGQGAVETAELILTERNTRLPKIAEALFKAGDLPNFKRLLRPCAFYLDAAYTMCGLLAQAYPAQVAAIAKVVNDGRFR